MNFTPKLFIGIGATNAFYTLRETYLYEKYIPRTGYAGNSVINGVYQGEVFREIRSFHHFNLSIDLDEALTKAAEYAERMGLPLEADKEKLEQEMREIKRATAEELVSREKARLDMEAFWAAQRQAMHAENIAKIETGEVSFGKFIGRTIDELPRDYLTWLVKKLGDFGEGSLLRRLAEVVRERYSHLLLPEPLPNLTIGEIGERITLDVEVLRNYPVQTDFGTLYIITMVSAERACVISKSTSFHANVGDKLKLKATVKSHDTYKGQAQTRIQRIKIIQPEQVKLSVHPPTYACGLTK